MAAPEELEILRRQGGFILRLRVSAGARKARILGVHGGALKLSVTQPPERGKANEGVIALIADALGLGARDVTIVSGATSPDKRVAVAGFPGDEAELKRRLAANP